MIVIIKDIHDILVWSNTPEAVHEIKTLLFIILIYTGTKEKMYGIYSILSFIFSFIYLFFAYKVPLYNCNSVEHGFSLFIKLSYFMIRTA